MSETNTAVAEAPKVEKVELSPAEKNLQNRVRAFQPAWQGVSTNVAKDSKTALEAIASIGLNYEVKMKPAFVWQDRPGGKTLNIPNKMATFRADTGAPIGIVGPRYRIVQNKDAFGFFDSIIESGEAKYTMGGLIDGGSRLWLQAKLPSKMIIKGDELEKYIVLLNSHDGSTPLRMFTTTIRISCQNAIMGLLRGASDAIAIRHSGNVVNKVALAREVLINANKYYGQFEKVLQQLADRVLTPEELKRYMNLVVFDNELKEKDSPALKNKRDAMLTLFERGMGNDQKKIRHTAWTALNAVTEYVDHRANVKGEKENPSARLDNIWFGSGAAYKRHAFDSIIKIAGLN